MKETRRGSDNYPSKDRKAKARRKVVLGFMDPSLDKLQERLPYREPVVNYVSTSNDSLQEMGSNVKRIVSGQPRAMQLWSHELCD